MAKAISVRQPWAWLLVHGHKDIENRNWRPKHRGKLFIHAAQKIDKPAYQKMIDHGYELPPMDQLVTGAIIGHVDLVDVVQHSDSPWFTGPNGLVVENARIYINPLPLKGQLNIFETGIEVTT